MELGTGVFLSAVFLGMVALFIATKERWNWKKFFLWPVATVFSLSIIGGAGMYFYNQYQSRPVLQTALWGIALGASPADIKFAKGEPSRQISEDLWQYGKNDGSYVVGFKDEKVRFIAYDGEKYKAPTIAGISPYSSIETMKEKLGEPSYVSRSKDELRRWYTFDKFNVIALFEKGEVTSFGIIDSKTGAMRFKDEAQ